MISTSSLYNSIFADANHEVEWKITVNGTAYEKDKISAIERPKLNRSLLTGNEPTVGECVAATFSCAILEASSAVPRMATVVPAYRLTLGSSVSEWITLGTFYIDTRKVDKASRALILECFDRMLVGGVTYADVTGFDEWPQNQSAVVSEIASIMGVTVDARTSIGSGDAFKVDYPNDYTMLEVLGYIGAANAGNWCITPANSLRLVPLTGGSGSQSVGGSIKGLKTSPALAAWSGVAVYWDDEEAYEAGTDTGRVLMCDCPWATQATANAILAAISGSSYQPFSADGAIINLALELGDSVTSGLPGDTVSGPVFTINITCGGLEQASIAAPGEDEIDHEYPYASYVDRSLKRKVGLDKNYYGVTISRRKGIEIARGDGESEAIFNSDVFAMRAKIDGVMKDRLYFDPLRGDFVFDGLLDADALVADAIYAERGDIAELTVDRLSTSKRVRFYNLRSTQDDNFLQIQDHFLWLVTGSVMYDPNDPTTPLTQQATNRFGRPLYWQKVPVSYTLDGYPLDENGVQIYASIEEPVVPEGGSLDDYKVMVYRYRELVKASLAFENENGTYVPQLIMGAGDNYGRTKGILHKAADGFDIGFIDSNGDEQGIKMWSAGYMDLYGLRKPTELDFSGWDYGYFSEEFDGGQTGGFLVDFDAEGRPVKFTDGNGHETVVDW